MEAELFFLSRTPLISRRQATRHCSCAQMRNSRFPEILGDRVSGLCPDRSITWDEIISGITFTIDAAVASVTRVNRNAAGRALLPLASYYFLQKVRYTALMLISFAGVPLAKFTTRITLARYFAFHLPVRLILRVECVSPIPPLKLLQRLLISFPFTRTGCTSKK